MSDIKQFTLGGSKIAGDDVLAKEVGVTVGLALTAVVIFYLFSTWIRSKWGK